MKHLCTVSDNNYLLQGLALYESLKRHTSDFVLHYYCIDEKTYEVLVGKKIENLKVYRVEELILEDERLGHLRSTEYPYFCWCLASYISNRLLHLNDEPITYIDSDIYFHKNIDIILDEIGNRDVGIFRHRQFSLTTHHIEGHYNVGIVHFKNTNQGREVSDWWADAVLYKKYPQYATCGDQKYLDHFPIMCPPDRIYIDENIGHGAPWLWQIYHFLGDGKIKWKNHIQDLIFTHFSKFFYNGDSYIGCVTHHCYTPLSEYTNNPHLKSIYDEYYGELNNINEKYIK